MSLKIKTIEQLREKVLKAFDDLGAGYIDVTQAGIIAKLSETIVSGLKVELEYARLTGSTPCIPFIAPHKDAIDVTDFEEEDEEPKRLGNDWEYIQHKGN